MDSYRPQDEYFEWDDIMVYKGPSEETVDKTYPPTVTRTFSFDSSDNVDDDFAWSDVSSLSTTPSSLSSTISLGSLKDDRTEAELDFPSYDDDSTSCTDCVSIGLDDALALTAPPSPILDPVSDIEDLEPLSRSISRAEVTIVSRDDSSLNLQPFRNVNYLTHDWAEEDIPSSLKYIESRRADWASPASRRPTTFNNIPRYENALWRSWNQRRFNLPLISPETINWMKSCDDTTLFGPCMMKTDSSTVTADCSRSSRKSSLKPLLKRPAMSEILIRGSIPTFVSTRGEHQTTIQAKPSYDLSEGCPGMSVSQHKELTAYSLQKLGLNRQRKSVRFSNEVGQCEIMKVRVSSVKSRRTLKILPSTTLDKESYNLPAPVAQQQKSWSTPIVAETKVLVPAPIRIQKTVSEQQQPPRSKHHRSNTTIIGTGNLSHQSMKYEVVEDDIEYLLATASPPSGPSSSESSSDSDSDDYSFTAPVVAPKRPAARVNTTRQRRNSKDLDVVAVKIVGDEAENEVERQMYREMEEFDLVLG